MNYSMIFVNGFFAYHPQNSVIIGKKSPENFGTKENRPPKIYGMVIPCPRSFDKAS